MFIIWAKVGLKIRDEKNLPIIYVLMSYFPDKIRWLHKGESISESLISNKDISQGYERYRGTVYCISNCVKIICFICHNYKRLLI